MTTLSKTERRLYKSARFTGDLNAALRGPAPYAKRLVRRRTRRLLLGLFR